MAAVTGFVSAACYLAFSEGIHNHVRWCVEVVRKVLESR
jgi:hypothetical protein